ncbi:hypothetical protein N7478_001631 [Penicillium angulare]|uniref:uncharacterized protein n=1 Tax=Penicillium angulare TaxID=116970 RepID=UPI002540D649|nr:uncharacterized protein N7478_001631 [Penicillium angulare]KAJ5288601.1 hypothetical protein N7478_001631 [Penicillium angulare]
MQPNHCDLLGQVREPRAASQLMRDGQSREHGQPRPSGAAPMRSEDSWIEVSSQPSSSSLSSAATSDDIITTGLRVEHRQVGMNPRRTRRQRMQHLAAVTTAQVDYSSRDASLASSSQEEYDESESDPDPNMSSSNEDIHRPTLPIPRSVPSAQSDEASSEDEDEDDASTALGMGISPSPFIPQPNVFTHPPLINDPSWTRPSESRRSQPSVLSNSSRRTAIRRDSYNNSTRNHRRTQSQHSPYNMISPSHHADHDAALRASLSTLLSCAAAARGLPKPENQQNSSPGPSRPAQPSSFRLVGESVAIGGESDEENDLSPRYTETSPPLGPRIRGPPRSPSSQVNKAKRRSVSPKDRSASSKKSRRASLAEPTAPASPTIMTWVISAGVVVLFSAISFSAGYMIGREVGRTEMGIMDGGVPAARSSAGCGHEAVRGGLRRLRWGTAAAGSASLA